MIRKWSDMNNSLAPQISNMKLTSSIALISSFRVCVCLCAHPMNIFPSVSTKIVVVVTVVVVRWFLFSIFIMLALCGNLNRMLQHVAANVCARITNISTLLVSSHLLLLARFGLWRQKDHLSVIWIAHFWLHFLFTISMRCDFFSHTKMCVMCELDVHIHAHNVVRICLIQYLKMCYMSIIHAI